jgi:hypothetical protein
MKKFLLFLVLLLSTQAEAGYFEIGASGSYRKTSYDAENFLVYRSGTASVAYYFWEMSAIELNYTKSRQDEKRTQYESRSFITFYGADLIFSLASRKSLFQPYIKVGIAHQNKTGSYKQSGIAYNLTPVEGWAPSAGIGFKIIIGQHIAIKTGIDVWSSPLSQDKVSYDYAGRLGLSFLF